MTKLVIIDGNSLANRAFYALPFLTNSKVEPSGAVYGFANLLTKIIVDYRPDGIVVAFDHARHTFRNNIFEEYKGTRKPTPPELISQFPVIKKMLETMEIKVIEEDQIEADDIIGTISKNTDCDKIIISGDRDLLQLIDEKTEVWLTVKGVTEVMKVNQSNLEECYGVSRPDQVIELKALMGDNSDNIPGVKGIGDKSAHKLLKEYDNIDNIYNNIDDFSGKTKEKLIDGKSMAYLSKTLATIKTDCEFPFNLNETKYQYPFSQKTYDFFNDWNFNTLVKRRDLFEDQTEFEVVDENLQKIKIDNLSVVKEMIAKIDKEFAYSFEKMEFCVNSSLLYYIEPEISMFSETVALEDVLCMLKDVFENKDILKITDSAKSDLHKLDSLGIDLVNYFDMTLAGYVLYTGVTSNKVSEMSASTFFSKRKQYLKNMEEFGTTSLYYDCELPLVKVLFDIEKCGFKIDKDELHKVDVELTSELAQLVAEIYQLAGEEFNLNAPKSVAHILFEKLELKAYNNKKQSTSVEILNEIAWQHPIVDKIIRYRKLQKLKTSYIEVYKKLCEFDDVLHTQFNQTLTNTGRLSSSEPNLQNIPTRDEDGRIIRKMFISKFDDGLLISADYNQIELRLLAELSGEESLIKAYSEGKDIHALTASQIFNVPLEEVTSNQRRSAKAVNFGVIYGISNYGLAQNLHIPQSEAKDYITSYFERYPKVKIFNEDCINYAREHGYVKTKFGRIRHIPEIHSTNYNMRQFAERVAMNMPLQGTASDIIKFAMIKVYSKLKEEELKSELILQIHDELIVDVYPGEMEKVKEILINSMQNVVKLNIPLMVNCGIGKNLYECKD